MAFLKPPPKSYENFDDDDNHEHDEDNSDAIDFSAKVKCTNDMVSFKKIFKEGEDAETADRLRQIGLTFGTLQEVIMLMILVVITVVMIVVKRLVMMTMMTMMTVMTMMTIMTRKSQKP